MRRSRPEAPSGGSWCRPLLAALASSRTSPRYLPFGPRGSTLSGRQTNRIVRSEPLLLQPTTPTRTRRGPSQPEVSRERARSNGALRRSMIHLPLLCPSRRGATGVHLRRILTRCRRVRLAHLILRNCCADGGARTSVRRSARMGLVGCDGQPKIAIREQGRFPVKRSSDRDFLSTLVTSGTPCHDGMIAPMRFRLASPQALVCALPGRSAHESTTVSSALSI
jgi:hypothetical protein